MATYKVINETPILADFWWRQPLINADGTYKTDAEGNIQVEQMVVRTVDDAKITACNNTIAEGKTYIQEQVAAMNQKIEAMNQKIEQIKNTVSCSANHLIKNLTDANSYTLEPKKFGIYNITLTVGNSILNINKAGLSAEAVAEIRIYLKQGTGSNTVTWTTGIKWLDGIVPVLSKNVGDVNIVTLSSVDGGTTWYGAVTNTWK